MFPYLFKIGPIGLRVYSLMYILALFIGIFIAKNDDVARKRGVKESDIENLAYVALFSGLIGGRLYYVLLNLQYYSKDPIEAFKVWHGGLAIHGGIIGGMIGVLIYSIIKKYKFLLLTDLAVGPLIFGQALGRIGNFANGEIQGVPVFTPLSVILKGNFYEWWAKFQQMTPLQKGQFKNLVPWGVVFPKGTMAGDQFPNTLLHPAMLYELILNLIAFYLIWFVFRKKEYKIGILSMIYLISYGIIRYIVSMFRAEDLHFLGFKAPYIASILMIIIGIVGIILINKNKKNS